MAYPSPEAIAAIRARVPDPDWAAKSDAAILAALEADTVANPEPRAEVPAPLYESAVMGLLTDPTNGSVGKLLTWVNFHELKQDIRDRNRDGVLLWCAVLPGLGHITAGEAAAVAGYVQSTVADPSYRSTIPAIEAEIGRPIDLDDVAASRPGA